MARSWQTLLVGFCVVAFAAATFVYFRAAYTHGKRLHVVVPGRFYRCGQLTADGFTDAVERFGIRTIVNVQEDVPDPELWHNYFDRSTIKESALCRQLGVRYVWLAPDLVSRYESDPRPKAIDEFLALMDDESTWPVLLHCKAGLHRTGLLAAVFRMEYQGWSPQAALRELKAYGFGEWAGTAANDYVNQYLIRYQPRQSGVRSQGSGVGEEPAATP
jgi:hypothetical protein